jgi:hypothetical protein
VSCVVNARTEWNKMSKASLRPFEWNQVNWHMEYGPGRDIMGSLFAWYRQSLIHFSTLQ